MATKKISKPIKKKEHKVKPKKIGTTPPGPHPTNPPGTP